MNGAGIFDTVLSKCSVSKLCWIVFPYLAGKPIYHKKQLCQHPCMTMTYFGYKQVAKIYMYASYTHVTNEYINCYLRIPMFYVLIRTKVMGAFAKCLVFLG